MLLLIAICAVGGGVIPYYSEPWAVAKEFSGYTSQIGFADVTTNGKIVLAHGDFSPVLSMWDVQTGTYELRCDQPAAISDAQLSADGQRIVTAGNDGIVRVWDGVSGKELCRYSGHTRDPEFGTAWTIRIVAFSPDGGTVLSVADGNGARIWDARSGTETAKFTDVTLGMYGNACYSQDGKTIAITERELVRIRNATSGAILREFPSPPGRYSHRRVAFSHDGKKLLVVEGDAGSATGKWDIFDLNTGAHLAGGSNGSGRPVSAEFSPDDSEIVVAFRERTAVVADALTGALKYEFKVPYATGAAFLSNDYVLVSSYVQGLHILERRGSGTVRGASLWALVALALALLLSLGRDASRLRRSAFS